MPRKRRPKTKAKTTAIGRRISKSLKKYHAQVKQIAKKEKLTYADARGRARETFIETIRRGEGRTWDTWYGVGQTKKSRPLFRRVKKKDIPKIRTRADIPKFTYGKRRSMETVQKSIAQHQYWALVDRMARMWGLSSADARKLLKRMQQEMTKTARAHGKKNVYRPRDAAAVLEFSDRYEYVRDEFGI